MATVNWTIKNYDLDGNGITAADMTTSATVSNQIKHSTNRQLGLALNGIDQLDFTLFLDDPMALQIRRLHNVVKLWRTVLDDDGNPIYQDPDGSPCFAGRVVNTIKDGEDNTMAVTAFSPLWNLQCHFHILNHLLKTNPDTDELYTESELMWKLIDLVNNAFGIGISGTGIEQGTFSSPTEITVAPFFVQRGSNTWSNIYDGIMSRAGGVDLIPEYVHTDGDPTLMFFSTDEKRGEDISGTTVFRFHTGSSDNLSNLTEEETPIPNEFANFVWAVGQGGTNSGKIALDENVNDDDDGYETIGIYMRRADFEDEKEVGSAGPPATHLMLDAQSELAQSRVPKTAYTASISETADIYYGNDYSMGDVVLLEANKGALLVSSIKQRIYEVTLNNSDNNVEAVTAGIANDFTGKVAS